MLLSFIEATNVGLFYLSMPCNKSNVFFESSSATGLKGLPSPPVLCQVNVLACLCLLLTTQLLNDFVSGIMSSAII